MVSPAPIQIMDVYPIRCLWMKLLLVIVLTKASRGISVHPVQNNNLLTWGTGKDMGSKSTQKNYYLCAYSNVGCGSG